MTEKRFEDIELLILDGYIRDNYYDEKISNPTKLIKTLNELHEENKEMDKENSQLHNEIRELSLIGDKQAKFIQMKGSNFKEFIEFLKQEKCFDFTKKPENTKRFENSGRTIIDNESKQHYIMTMDWEVSIIVKLLNKFHEENQAYKLRGLTENECHKRYERIFEISGELIDEYEEKLDPSDIEDNLPYYMSICGAIEALKRLQARMLNEK